MIIVRIMYSLAFICLTWAVVLLTEPSPASPGGQFQALSFEGYMMAPEPSPVVPEQSYDIVVVRAKVTACSPQDAMDQAYYAKHGYEGSVYNIAADLSVLPRGTRIKVPGYMPDSYPDHFWEVDSAGGSIIRRATRRGELQFDVKFRTEHSALQWGVQWLDVEIQVPRTEAGANMLRKLRPHIVTGG